MAARKRGPVGVPGWAFNVLAVVVTLVCAFYTYAGAYLVPYPGFGLSGLTVTSIEPCAGDDCGRRDLQEGDVLLAVGELDAGALAEPGLVPFGGYAAGEAVPVRYLRDGEEREGVWTVAGPTAAGRFGRLSGSAILFAPYWLAGTLILLFLRPRDARWRLLLLFNYVTAAWLAVGYHSAWKVAYAGLVSRSIMWLMVPIYTHLHFSVPISFTRGWRRGFLWALYVFGIASALFTLCQVLPDSFSLVAMLLAFAGALGPLLFRRFRQSPADLQAMRIIRVGILVCLGLPILLWALPRLLGTYVPSLLVGYISRYSLASLPFFYLYALFKHRLGAFEFRANRLLSVYLFVLLYVVGFVAAFSLGSGWLDLSDDALFFSLAISTLFALVVSPLRRRFQQWVDRLAYGITYSPDEVVPAFVRRISTTLSYEALGHSLADEIAPSLLIRQSALILLLDDEVNLVYAEGVKPGETPVTLNQVRYLMAAAERYRPPPAVVRDAFDWVRLAVPLEARGDVIGAWLLGRRDPDDYYTQEDVALLNTLADQVAVAVENARLYDQARVEIAERKRAQEALRESERMVRGLLDATTDSVVLVNAEETILSLNQTAAARTGREVGEIVGLRGQEAFLHGALPPGLFGPGRSLVGEVVRCGKSLRFEEDCGEVVFDTTVYPIFDREGRVTRVAIFARDITARKRAVQQAIRTERLAAMGYMATALAHEVNNPLQIIQSSLDLLLRFDLKQEEQRERLGVVSDEIERLIEMTRRVLDLIRPSEDVVQPVAISHLVERAIALMARRFESAHVLVTTGFPPDSLFVSVAPAQIVQVLLNLMSNAMQVMPDGGAIGILAHAEGDDAVLAVTNDGPCLTKEEIEHIFDPFFTTRPEGTGLGLFISRSIIEQHGGTIKVQNLDGQGVSFTIVLPLTDDSELEEM